MFKHKFLFILFFALAAIFMPCAQCAPENFTTVNVSDDEYGDDMYTPAIPLLFSEISRKIANAPVELVGFNSSMVDVLNNIEAPENRLDEKYYYKIIAKKLPRYKRIIKSDIYRKFGEKSAVLNSIKWRPARPNELVLYSMVKKNVEFFKHFEILNPAPFNSSRFNVKYFGVNNKQRLYANYLKPLFYNNSDDYAILIRTKTNDEIILYRTNSTEPVDIVYDEMGFKIQDNNDTFQTSDRLLVPFINVKQILNYNELTGKKIKKTNLTIYKVFETVEFSLDNKGARLKNEGVISAVTTSLVLNRRNFNFNKPFVLFIRETGKENPYFMLRVKDTRFLVKTL